MLLISPIVMHLLDHSWKEAGGLSLNIFVREAML
jgi:hypothetical protein